MDTNGRHHVMFLPGGIAPTAVRYGALLPELGDEVEPLHKDLEVYAEEEPGRTSLRPTANRYG